MTTLTNENLLHTDNTRNAGIDLLKVISMFMIVLLHINIHGGILSNVTPLSANWYVSNIVEFLCLIGVNLFALTSGYLYYNKQFKIKNIISLWLQVFFFSFGISLIFLIVKGTDFISIKELLYSMIPVTSNQYWYFSSYFLLFFTIPLLNIVVKNLNKKQMLIFLSFILILFSTIGFLTDPFGHMGGYSTLWLIVLYLVGAFIKKYNFKLSIKNKPIKNYLYLLLYLLLTMLNFILTIILTKYFNHGIIASYVFILNSVSAISLFLFFINLNIKQSKFLTILSSSAFGVYLISEQFLIRKTFITDYFIQYVNYNPLALLGIIILAGIIIYIVCTIIELVRQLLFKLLRVNKALDSIQKKSNQIYDKYIKEAQNSTDDSDKQ